MKSCSLACAVVAALAILSLAVYVDARAAQCRGDTDCFPATCCHAAICVTKAEMEKCDGKTCSQECQPFTMDCGGKCVCNAEHRCAAVLNNKSFAPVGGGIAGDAGGSHHHKKYTYIHVRVKGYPKHHGG